MENKSFITPRKLQGFWELMPNEEILFSTLLNKLEKVFQENCFVPLDTPVLEYSETLLAKSGGDTDNEIYRFSKGDTDMCMRYDLTVPLARFVSMHKNELNFPFKRYQIGKVYRGERPQKGRFREFYQCDADIIGNESLSMVADAECVSLFDKCFKALNLDTIIHISNRKILNGYIENLQKQDKTNDILILLDKLAKINHEDAVNSLTNIGLTENQANDIICFAQTTGTIEEIEKQITKQQQNESLQTGFCELKEVDKFLKQMNCKDYIFDLSIIRGHNYYTGTVFEGFLKNGKISSALGGGGRYQNLCSYFSDKEMPGVGMSVGVTRLFSLLMEENMFDISNCSNIDCVVITFDETFNEGLKIVQTLREKGVKAEIFYENKSFKSQMKEANKRDVNFVLIVGEEEVQTQNYTLKNMKTSEQQKISLDKIVEIVKKTQK